MAITNAVGQPNFASSLHYFSAIPTQTAALAYAARERIIIGQFSKFSSYPEAMITQNPTLVIGPYGKGVEDQHANTYFPDAFYAHDSTGAKINVFNSSTWLMQADHSVTTPFSDSRGFTASTWRDWRSKDAWKIVTDENAKYATDPYLLTYLDSLSAVSGLGGASPVSWQDGHTYTNLEFRTINYSVGDATKTQEIISPRYTFGNGLRNGLQYASGATSDLPAHLDGVVAESWLRDNGASPTVFRSETDWRKEIDVIKQVTATGVYVWVVVNINNSTAGGGGFVPATFTSAQLEQWKRYSIATYMIANDGMSFIEWVESTSVLPWNDSHPYYSFDLGAPLDTLANAAAYLDASGAYKRRFTNGCAYVNPTSTSKTITPDRTYKNLDGSAIVGNITLAANSGLVVLTAGAGGGGGGTGLTNFFTDLFNRTVAPGGVGTSDTGNTYTLAGTAADYQVDGLKAVVNVPLTSSRRMIPNTPVKQDVDEKTKVSITELAVGAGGNEVHYLWARVDGAATTAYRLKMLYEPTTNAVKYLVQKIVAGVTTTIGVTTTAAWTANVGDVIGMRLVVSGVNPTVVQGHIWRDGVDTEPATYPANGSDSEATLQLANGIAVSMFIETGNTNAPANFYIHEWIADEITPAPPPNEPPSVSVLSPADGSTFQIAKGSTTFPLAITASATDADGTISLVTVSINGGTDQVMLFDGLNYTKSFDFQAGTYQANVIATDNNGAVASATVNFTVNAADVVVVVVSEPVNLEWSVKHLDHNGNPIGEALGQDFRFGKYLGNAGFISYDLSMGNPLVTRDLEPHAVDWGVYLGGTPLSAGEITQVDRDTDATIVSITGTDWQGYFDVLPMPYNPANPKNFARTNTDLKDIVEGLVNFVISKYPNSIDVIMNNDPTGLVQSWHFMASDLETLSAMIDKMATQSEGFDWEIRPNKQLVIYAPKKTAVSDFVIDQSNIKQVHYGQQGIKGTTLYGRGTGSGTSQLVTSATNSAASLRYRDRVAIQDYDVSNINALTRLVKRDLNRSSAQLLEFWVTIFPPVGVDVWTAIEPGWNVRVKFSDGNVDIDGSYRCIGYETYINPQGDAEVTYNFNTEDTFA